MYFYIRCKTRKTSVTVSDSLVQYLAVKHEAKSLDPVEHKRIVQKWINDHVRKPQVRLPDAHLSQWLQAEILACIVDPIVHEKLTWMRLNDPELIRADQAARDRLKAPMKQGRIAPLRS